MARKYNASWHRVVDGRIQKLCRGCGEWKELHELSKQPRCVGGRSARCKVCDNARWELAKFRVSAERAKEAG